MEISVGDADEVLPAAAFTRTETKKRMFVTLDDLNSLIHPGPDTHHNIFVDIEGKFHILMNEIKP